MTSQRTSQPTRQPDEHSELRTGGPIDALGEHPPGRYEDELVEVVRAPSDGPRENSNDAPREDHRGQFEAVVATRHFHLFRNRDRVRVDHRVPPEHLDNELAGMLADELFAPGWLSGSEVFERVFTGVVKTTVDDPVEAWALFYDNTLRSIRDRWEREPGEHASSLDEIVPVYRRSLELVPRGRVLDLGSCFGFLTMLLAERTRTEVIATDINGGTIDLLRRIGRRRCLPLGSLVCDGARIPLPAGAVDTVLAVHVLEHLEPEHGAAVLTEALRLARRQVVVAVPFERAPTLAYGHVRTFDLPTLEELGRHTGEPFRTEEYHGGWLIIDRSSEH